MQLCTGVLPNEAVEQEDCAADYSGSAGLLVLGAWEGQAIVHVTLMVHYSLNTQQAACELDTHSHIDRHGPEFFLFKTIELYY